MIENIQDYFNASFTRERLTTTETNIATHTEAWGSSLSFEGLKRPLSGDKRMSADRLTLYATDKIYCGVIDIKEEDRIKDASGNIYTIKEIINPMSMNNHLEIVVKAGE